MHPSKRLRISPIQLLIFLILTAPLAVQAPALRAQIPASENIPAVGDSPADAGPLANNLSPAFKKKDCRPRHA